MAALKQQSIITTGYQGIDVCAGVQIAAYGGLDVAAKVFFGFMVMAAGPIIQKQTDRENKE